MSDIPKARELLLNALDNGRREEDLRTAMWQALELMERKKPDFVAPRRIMPLTADQQAGVRLMRSQGIALNEIARRYNTNIGRVSEAVNN